MEGIQGKEVRKFTWKITSFSSIKQERLYSDVFLVGGNKWRVLIYPKGNNVDQFSIFLDVADSVTLPDGWRRYAQFRLAVINQIDRKNSISVTSHGLEFSAEVPTLGYSSFLPLSQLHDPGKGYLINDACLVEVDVATDRTLDLLSHKVIDESAFAEFKGKEADHGKPAIKKQKIFVSKEKLLTARSIYRSEAIADITREDIYTFFTGLGPELASHKIDSSREEAKQALAKIDDALIMAPANLYDVGNFSPVKKAIKFLCSSDCSSALTNEQKTQLLDLEENLKELPKRAAKAMQDKNLFAEKEYSKLTLFRDLEKSLKIFKHSKAELEQVEQKIDALFKQLDEAQNNKMKILAGWRQNFKTTKDMKMELEALGKEWPVYEARANAAEVEAKIVAAQWSKMKDFVTSLKDRFRKGTN